MLLLLLLQAKSHLYLTFVAKSFQPEESYLVFANVLQTDNFFHNFFDKMLLSECSGSRFQICTQLALEADRMLCVILPCRIFCCGPTKLQWAVVVASRTHTIKSEAILSLLSSCDSPPPVPSCSVFDPDQGEANPCFFTRGTQKISS